MIIGHQASQELRDNACNHHGICKHCVVESWRGWGSKRLAKEEELGGYKMTRSREAMRRIERGGYPMSWSREEMRMIGNNIIGIWRHAYIDYAYTLKVVMPSGARKCMFFIDHGY